MKIKLNKNMKTFNVILRDINKKDFVYYDIIPYFVSRFKKKKKGTLPSTIEEFKDFVKKESQYMFWGRCEYELILSSWPPSKTDNGKKIDVHWQIMMNIDIIANIVMSECLNVPLIVLK